MAAPDWEELTQFAVSLARASEAPILAHFRKNAPVDVKSGAVWDPVTEGDRAGERTIRQLIEARYPDHGIHGEEYGIKEGRSPFTWLLDPVDGTRSFVCGMPTWATLIGLSFEGRPVIGVMNQPVVGDLYSGSPQGAWNDYRGTRRAIRVRPGVALARAAVGTTAPELYRSARDAAAFAKLRTEAQLVRYGGDAYFYCVLAAGHLDLAMDANLQAYDIAPLLPIVAGAGGVAAEWNGGDPAHGGGVICATSPALLDEAMAIMAG